MAEIATAAGSKAAEKVTETVYDFICRKISYVFKYQKYMEKAKEQVKEVRSRKRDVEADVDVAERQGEEIYNEVKDWLRGMEGFMEREVKLVDDEDKAKRRCFRGLCPNLMKRYRLSKDAEQVAEDGAKLLKKGKFSGVSHPVILQRTESIFVGEEYEHFHSRESNFNDIMEALKDSTINMIGVYGMGGVGKTTLVRKVAWKAKEDNLFDEVVFAEVTQIPDLKQIQADIAGQLGMVFRDQESLSGRADQLRYRLKKAKRILVIVDNIWKKLDLKVVGIPFSYDDKGSIQQDKKESDDEQVRCTILLTARTQVVLKQMNTQRNVSVKPLGDGDARNLFGTIVGDLKDKCDIAAEIIEKCAGLPLAITTIANALKGKSDSVWRDALRQLENSNPRCVPEMDNTLYSTIELSYALLNSEEAKSLLLLCALSDAGSDIYFIYLLAYGMGLGLFQDVYTINDRKNRIKSLIDYLEASCLLLKGNHNETVKMHDITHVVVASIAKEKRMFNIQDADGFKEVLVKGMYKDSIAIYLRHGDIDGLPERVNHFFQGMMELKVLRLLEVHLLPLPSSFLCLTNLQTLTLEDCTLGDIAMIGELRNLEILVFDECEFEQLPESFRQLTQLKFLQLTDCPKLKVITPNVIASLSRLEELCIDNSFDRWEVEGRNNASLAELKRLSQLNTLWIHIPNLQIIQQNFVPGNLETYNVHIGDTCEWSCEYESPRTLRLKFNRSLHLRYGVEILVKKAKDLYLDQVDGVKDILWELDGDGFPQLKRLSVKNSSEVLYIVNSMGCNPSNDAFPILESLLLINLSIMEKICCGLVDAKSFSKLRILKVEKCDRVRYLFSSSMASNISQIQEIEVTDCKELKEIFGQESAKRVDENERNCKIEFKQLHSLVLQCLPQFTSFGLKVVLPRLENLKLSSINIENIWVDQPEPMSSYIQCLKSLIVEECNGLKFMFSSSMVKSLVQLQKLVICNCKSMEAVIFDSEGLEGEDKIIDFISFPKLFYLKLEGLPKLTRFGTGNSIEFPTLNELHIGSCSNLKTFFHKSFGPDMLRKEPEEVSLEKHITDINPLFNETVAFPSLEKMMLFHLDNLQLIWHSQLYGDSFSKLKKVRVEFCEKLRTTVPSNSTQGLLTFHNLETLIIENCWNMKSLFPVSIATGLLQLKELWISSCGLEEIVAKEEVDGTPTFLFPQLTFLKLQNLAELRHFYLGLHTIEWPMLKCLVVYDCGKTKLYALDGESQPAMFSFEKVTPNLETLGLNGDYITSRCLDRIPARSFSKLKFLNLACLDKKSVAFWFGVLQKLYHLDSLCLYDCTLEELFPCEGYLWKKDSQVDTFLQNLQTLKIWRCHRLTYLMSSSTISFKNIQNLEVHYCNGLANILACSAARALVHLTTIRITECKLVTEVIVTEVETTEEEIVFSQLKILELHCLTSLASFSSANCAFEFPCLEQVIVSQCPNLKIFSRGGLSTPKLKRVRLTKEIDEEYLWNDDLNSTIYQMFTNMVGFSNLEHLKLSEFPTLKERFWNAEVPASLFYSLKLLVLDMCLDTSTAIPFHVLCNLKNLERLEIRSCDSLKEVFDMEGQPNVDGHALKKSHQEVLDLNNLKSFEVHNCCSLRHIFTPSIILGLAQLKEIRVINCALIEEIISKEEEKEAYIEKIMITQLNFIILDSLPNLRSFYSGMNTLECPALKAIIVAKCPQIETFVFADIKHQSDHIVPLFSEKVAFPSLEKMMLLHLDNLQLIWHNQLHKYSFSNLKEVRVENCEKLLTIVRSNSTQRLLTFHNLETLIVESCWNMKSLFPVSIATGLLQLKELWISSCGLEEIVAKEEVDGTPTFLFPQLTFLKLQNLAELRHFYLGLHTIEWPMLKCLVVYDCGKTKLYALDGESQPAMFSFEKVIPNLENLCLNGDNITSRCLDRIPARSFSNLKFLTLAYLDKKSAAFWFGIGFSNLEHLKLSEFPTLKERFWDAEVPTSLFYSLKLLVLDMCLDTSTAIPFHVLCNLKNLEKLEIRSCDSLKEVFDMEGQLNVDGHTLKKSHQEVLAFNNLKSFKVHNSCSLRCIFTPSIILGLAQLEEIEVKNCALIEEIISKEEEKEADIEKIMVPRLNSIILESLPNLTSFYSGMNTLECLALKDITVAKCPQIETFVFADIKHQSDHIVPLLSEKVVFPSLEEMFLSHLDKLHLIWHNQLHADSFGKLKQVTIKFCEKLMAIVPSNNSQGLLTFHNLESLHVKKCWSMKSLFPVSTATGLVKLKELRIYSCELEEIVANEEVEGGPSLDLSGKVMPNLESLSLNVDAFRLQTKRPLEGFCKLKELCLRELNDESIPFFYGFLKRLYNLEILTLRNIRSKELFLYERDATKEDSQVDPFLPHLRDLGIWECHDLTHLWTSSVSFTNLTTLDVFDSNELINIFTCSTVKSLVQLTEMSIGGCGLLKEPHMLLLSNLWLQIPMLGTSNCE
ncbi:uncharacterized protein LOC116130617 [Pistacia vera]|uniref:uncharacterized protein LOC116130617 n=1 Tax=Pistacia vera TaxID=55513 RepID=UPI001263AB69|nr:uncharacterized protein LOC116130617 [Pistacia vera]